MTEVLIIYFVKAAYDSNISYTDLVSTIAAHIETLTGFKQGEGFTTAQIEKALVKYTTKA